MQHAWAGTNGTTYRHTTTRRTATESRKRNEGGRIDRVSLFLFLFPLALVLPCQPIHKAGWVRSSRPQTPPPSASLWSSCDRLLGAAACTAPCRSRRRLAHRKQLSVYNPQDRTRSYALLRPGGTAHMPRRGGNRTAWTPSYGHPRPRACHHALFCLDSILFAPPCVCICCHFGMGNRSPTLQQRLKRPPLNGFRPRPLPSPTWIHACSSKVHTNHRNATRLKRARKIDWARSGARGEAYAGRAGHGGAAG